MNTSVHTAAESKNHCFLDYVSFTWAPDQLASLRKLARMNRQTLADFLKADEASDVNHLDVNQLDSLCCDELKRFLVASSRNFFAECEFTTEDAWDEVFNVTERHAGMFGYRRSFDLYFSGQHIGIAAAGAKNGGCFLSLSGSGCCLIDPKKLQKELEALPLVKLTRVDIAFDDHEGIFDIAHARNMYKRGQFTNGGRPPKYQYYEGGILDSRGKMKAYDGRSFYVGSRESGKMLRTYEKGRQLGDQNSRWVRWEVELRSKDREIPLFALTKPADYFAGAFPALSFIAMYDRVEAATKIKTRKKKVKITYNRLVSYAKTAYGALINVMADKGMTSEEIVNRLIKYGEAPRSLKKAAEYVPRAFDAGIDAVANSVIPETNTVNLTVI